MPTMRKATVQDVEDFDRARKLQISLEEARRHVEAGELVYEGSVFSDPGDDYTKLMWCGDVVGYWEGY